MDLGQFQGLNREFIFDKLENGTASALFYITLLLLSTQDEKRNPYGISPLTENYDDIELSEFITDAFSANPGSKTINRIQAAIAGITSDAFEQDPDAHLIITAGLLGYDPSDGVVNEISFEDVIVASLELALMSGSPTAPSPAVEKLQAQLADASGLDPVEFGDDIDEAKILTLFAAEYVRKISDEFAQAGFPDSVADALRENFAS